uniref:Uncharacterized protein n=1 Tax=Anguilla anguilla TaxID=7936 RepID=A0A0E9Q2L2_ANGAN
MHINSAYERCSTEGHFFKLLKRFNVK